MHQQWALVVGGASCVWDDIGAWEAQYGKLWDGLTICVNDVACHWPRPIDHWVSLHPNKFRIWKDRRVAETGLFAEPETWGRDPVDIRHRAQHVFEPLWLGGSSGMYAVEVARRALGCTKIILCGIPMTVSSHFVESKEEFAARWQSADVHWTSWRRYYLEIVPWTRSMSGRTKELLGAPSLEWLHT